MLRQTILNANPVIVSAIEKLLDEERRFEQTERRATVREPVARPIIVRPQGTEEQFSAFSKNISTQGIGLISKDKFRPEMTAKIEIYTTGGDSPVFISELRWCQPFGKDWFASGWHFIAAARS